MSQEQIQYIDNYLQFIGVKFIDVRIELIDHLATEFETESEYVLLGDFLRTKRNFARKFEKQWDRSKHWGYQKSLLKRIMSYFSSVKNVFILLMIGFSIFLSIVSLEETVVKLLFFISLITPQIIYMYLGRKPKGMHKKILSAKYMGSIMALPSMFLYLLGLTIPLLKENTIWFFFYWFAAMVFNIAGIQEVLKCKNQILKNYSDLIKN
ncbi:hypothetical protein [Maribacter sp. R77961]|uniref:hypothetical protein n=1 Tax=Maribacter sp. R77961 TaxID=3093871 RepID=UPI0037C51874